MDIGTRISEIRKKKGFASTSSFARATEIPQTTLSGIEAGRNSPTWDTLERICKALGMEPWVLVGPVMGGKPIKFVDSLDSTTLQQLAQILTPRRKRLMEAILRDWIEETISINIDEDAASQEAVV